MNYIDAVLKAIQIVGTTTPEAMRIYEGFMDVVKGKDQEELKSRYAQARQHSDDLHAKIQHDLR